MFSLRLKLRLGVSFVGYQLPIAGIAISGFHAPGLYLGIPSSTVTSRLLQSIIQLLEYLRTLLLQKFKELTLFLAHVFI